MSTFRIHTTLLRECAQKYSSKSVLKVPKKNVDPVEWRDVSFTQFQHDIETYARYWADKLEKQGAKPRSVVGMWVRGLSYSDLLHQWGIARAGYIPQFCSLRLTDPAVTFKLVQEAEAVILVHDQDSTDIVKDCPVPAYPAIDLLDHTGIENLPLPDLWEPENGDDTTMFFHTSGSTSGIPKLVPLSARWNQNMIVKMEAMNDIAPATRPYPTSNLMGSFCHAASTIYFIQSMCRGGSYILPTSLPYSATELQRMIAIGDLSIFAIFPALLSTFLRNAQTDPALLASLQKLDYIMYAGLELDPTMDAWIQDKGLTMVNIFASTEAGLIMLSNSATGKRGLLKRAPKSCFDLVPLAPDAGFDEQLYEVVVPPEAHECPDASLLDPSDGKLHTGDLFAEVEPGWYTFKGRNDDWIKMGMAGRCDSGVIEKNIMKTCGEDIVESVIVVGAGRESPTIIVEPVEDIQVDDQASRPRIDELKNEICKRIAPFHKSRYIHERVDDPRFIIVVSKGTLPRTSTKGNIRRKQTEEAFKTQLDEIYSS